MTTSTLSIHLDTRVKKRLDALAKQSQRSTSFLAAEALAAYLDLAEWQMNEIREGIKEVDAGQFVSHEEVVAWMRSWGTLMETEPPR